MTTESPEVVEAAARPSIASLLKPLEKFAAETDVTIGETRFHIEKLPAVPALRLWRELRKAIVETPTFQSLGRPGNYRHDAFVITALISEIAVDVQERTQASLCAHMTYQNRQAVTAQPIHPAVQETALMGLDPLQIEELVVRGLAVNFFDMLQRLAIKAEQFLRTSPSSSSPSE